VTDRYRVDELPGRGLVRVALSGEIDLASFDSVQGAVAQLVRAPETSGLVIDLDDVTFLDSRGISLLIKCRKLADAAQTPFGVINPHGIVRDVLEVSGVGPYINLGNVPEPHAGLPISPSRAGVPPAA
jgi:anti-anti-sigma factor